MNIPTIKKLGEFIKSFSEAKEELPSNVTAAIKRKIKDEYRQSKGKMDKSNRRFTR